MMIPNELLLRAARWHGEEYERRTRAVAVDDHVSVYWIAYDQRVSWTEVAEFLLAEGAPRSLRGGIKDPIDIRVALQPLIEQDIRRRKLWSVWRGKMRADAWASAHPKVPWRSP